MKAFVPCAGEGLRLRPLTSTRPKPLVPLGGRPALYRVLDGLKRAGVTHAVANVWHRKERFKDLLGPDPLGLQWLLSEEDHLLDTGGGLARAFPLLAPCEPFLYHNGDILFEGSLRPALLFHEQEKNLATLLLSRQGPLLTVDVDATGGILSFRKPTPEGQRMCWIGVAVLSPEIRDFFPREEKFSILDVFRAALRSGGRIRGLDVGATYWTDYGTFTSYLAAHRDLGMGRWTLPREPRVQRRLGSIWLGQGAVLSEDARAWGFLALGSRSRVEKGAILKDVVIWEDCTIQAGAHLESCVVLDRVQVIGSHVGEVITGS